ncbi:MAG: hypothetical protein OXC95_09190 [Dehalococcoidia bacterium]|nr:hypothetical protein [Dehalococcoidia bacterium]
MDVDSWQLKAQIAMHEQGTLLEIARIILAFANDMDDLTREICREIVERHKYDHCAIYLSQVESDSPGLAHGARLGENLSEHEADALASESAEHSQSLISRNANSWRIAVPIEDGSITLGVLIVASAGSDADAQHALVICKALARLIAIGIQNAHLRKLTVPLST